MGLGCHGTVQYPAQNYNRVAAISLEDLVRENCSNSSPWDSGTWCSQNGGARNGSIDSGWDAGMVTGYCYRTGFGEVARSGTVDPTRYGRRS